MKVENLVMAWGLTVSFFSFCFLNMNILAIDCKYETEAGKQEDQKDNRQIVYLLYYFQIMKWKQFWQDAYATSHQFSLQLWCRSKSTYWNNGARSQGFPGLNPDIDPGSLHVFD